MHNALILGSGRSGTSLVAGMLAQNGYFMGDNLYPPHPRSNAKGFFECKEINDINEDILSTVAKDRPRFLGKEWRRDRPVRNQRWLLRLPPQSALRGLKDTPERIQALIRREPYCLKDPRFSYTLPVWRPHLKDARFVVVFRHPAQTAASILRECATRPYLRGLKMNRQMAVETWRAVYQAILPQADDTHWLFFHYRQAFSPEGRARLATFLGAKVDESFSSPELETSVPSETADPLSSELYELLCRRAGYPQC